MFNSTGLSPRVIESCYIKGVITRKCTLYLLCWVGYNPSQAEMLLRIREVCQEVKKRGKYATLYQTRDDQET